MLVLCCSMGIYCWAGEHLSLLFRTLVPCAVRVGAIIILIIIIHSTNADNEAAGRQPAATACPALECSCAREGVIACECVHFTGICAQYTLDIHIHTDRDLPLVVCMSAARAMCLPLVCAAAAAAAAMSVIYEHTQKIQPAAQTKDTVCWLYL